MTVATMKGRPVHIGADGFLTEYDEWDEGLPVQDQFALFPTKPAKKLNRPDEARSPRRRRGASSARATHREDCWRAAALHLTGV
jgi:hypothetical protein